MGSAISQVKVRVGRAWSNILGELKLFKIVVARSFKPRAFDSRTNHFDIKGRIDVEILVYS